MLNFVDYVTIHLKAGDGGDGIVSWRKEKFVPKGGPAGGDGGNGGNVIVEADDNLWTLLDFKYKRHIKAENGVNGGKSNRTGKSGENLILKVPKGTIVKDHYTKEFIGEVVENGEQLLLAKGGKGGLGNQHFKSSTRQSPDFALPGEKGEELSVIFELKVLADVGLVGFPNAGKSTLLSVLTAAKPKIANYPFTTLQPNLGIVQYRDFQSFVMADIPGIIDGAHEGKGLGAYFLRHIERNPVLLFLIPADADSYQGMLDKLLYELEQHDSDLLKKKRIIAVSKTDLLDEELIEEVRKEFSSDEEVYFFSSHTHSGLIALKDVLWKRIELTKKR